MHGSVGYSLDIHRFIIVVFYFDIVEYVGKQNNKLFIDDNHACLEEIFI